MPLQPTDVPSRAGIQGAIDDAVATHASTSVAASQHYDSDWVNLPLLAAAGTGTARVRRVGKVVSIEFATSGASIAVGSTATAIVAAGGIPADMRPTGPSIYSLGNGTGNIPTSIVTASNGSMFAMHQHTGTVSVVRCGFTYLTA